MMNLDSLNSVEGQLLSRVEQVTGLMKEKHEQLRESGVYTEYGKVYEAYVELIESESEGLEALKRATFLLWYEQAEPSCFSGVFGLSEESSRRVLESLERRAEANVLDSELKWMLPFYDTVAEWMFAKPDLPNLRAFLSRSDPESWQRMGLKAEDFTGRGQMGEYWLSIIRR
ncbi:MAG: hypothetical protein M3458_05505 [Acidobacteriota bacterium]|nr:hypothetical protein [Acidobacteriota bacterium]